MPLLTMLRRCMKPLRHTPLHPQWLAFRDEVRVRDWIGKLASGRVLDVGCAGGWARTALKESCDYMGLDFPATVKGMYGTRPGVFADGASLPFRRDVFDTVLLLEVLEHVAHPAQVLAEIQRVLKPGGILLLSMPFLYPLHDAPHDYQRFTAPGLARSLGDAGWQIDWIEPRNRGFAAIGLLAAIACADAVLEALKARRWRLLLAPLWVCAIPLVNIVACLISPFSGSAMIAGGHAVTVRKIMPSMRDA